MCRLKSKAKISPLFYQGQVALFFFGGSFGFGVQPTILIGKRVEVPSVEFPFYQRSDIRLRKGITLYGESSEAKVPFSRGSKYEGRGESGHLVEAPLRDN